MSSEPDGAAPSAVAYIPDHAEQAFRRLPSRDRNGKPNLAALARALGAGVQIVEDQIIDLTDGRLLQSATGAALDQWGAIVGEARGTLGDADYRRFISARIIVNTCTGDVEGMLAVWRIIVAPYTLVRWLPHYPGATLLVVRSVFLDEGLRRRVRRMMEDINPGGDQMELIEALDGYFGFDGDPYATGPDTGPMARIL